MERKDIDLDSKKEFSKKLNEQAGRTSSRGVSDVRFMTADQKKSWNQLGYILIPILWRRAFVTK